MKGTKRTWPFKSTEQVLISSQGLKHQAQGLHGPLCIIPGPLCIIAFSLAFLWDSRVCEWVTLWFLCLLLSMYSFCWVVLYNLNVMVFDISYIFIILLSFRILCFSSEKQRECIWKEEEVVRKWEEKKDGKLQLWYAVKNIIRIKSKNTIFSFLWGTSRGWG